jgi:hypothetical protein
MTGAQHVTVAVSRNPENAAPIAGSFAGPSNAFQGIQVDVTVVQMDRPLPPAAPAPAWNNPPQNQAQPQFRPNGPVQQAQQMAQQVPTPVMDMVIRTTQPLPRAPKS